MNTQGLTCSLINEYNVFDYRAFSHDITAANETAVYQTNPVGAELLSSANTVSITLRVK